MTKFQELCKELESEIEKAYTTGVTLEQAERYAAQFLGAQMKVSAELTKSDLDARMRKSGVKAVRAAVYLDTVGGAEKKPTEAQIAAIIDTNRVVSEEQDGFDRAEVLKAELERYYDIFLNAHIYFRGVAKGSFGG